MYTISNPHIDTCIVPREAVVDSPNRNTSRGSFELVASSLLEIRSLKIEVPGDPIVNVKSEHEAYCSLS